MQPVLQFWNIPGLHNYILASNVWTIIKQMRYWRTFPLTKLVFAPVGITSGDVLINDGEDHMYDINQRAAF